MTGGFFAVDRGLFDHSSFKPEPFTEREAWLWLISAVLWKPHRVRVGSIQVDLRRGQCAHSTRFMAEKWQWSEARVRRFLGRLKTDAMIDAATDAGITVVTVCNYDKYQGVPPSSDAAIDAATDAAATQQRRKEEELKTKKEEDDDGDRARAAENPKRPTIKPEAYSVSAECLKVLGFPEVVDAPLHFAGLPYQVEILLSRGIRPPMIVGKFAELQEHRLKPMNYFIRAIENAHAEQSKPRPINATQQRQSSGNPATIESAGVLDRIANFNRPFDPTVRGGSSEAPIRLLPEGRGERS